MGDSLKLREGLLRRSWASGAARADRRSESDTGLVSETKETASSSAAQITPTLLLKAGWVGVICSAADNGVTVGDKGESMRGF